MWQDAMRVESHGIRGTQVSGYAAARLRWGAAQGTGIYIRADVEVDSLLVTAEPSQRSASRPLLARLPWRETLIILGYVIAAILLARNLWQHPSQMAPTAFRGDVNQDVYLSTWFMRYAATALSHGPLPALTTMALKAPQGVNAMWTPSLRAPAVILAPVTLLAGPVTSLTLMITVGFAGSA